MHIDKLLVLRYNICMKVYRYLSQKELDLILANDTSSIGCEYSKDEEYSRVNNHKYKTGVKYLHFFRHKKDCGRVTFISDHEDIDFYVAEFNIPFTTLIRYRGYGRYNKQTYSDDLVDVVEFALPVSKFKPRYMLSYALDEIHHRSVEESKNLDEMFQKCKNIFRKSSLPELQGNAEKESQPAKEERPLGI